MNNKLETLKKKLIYRAGYRGTKEMDILLSSFVNKNINMFNKQLLDELDKFLNFEDEVILNYYQNNIVKENMSLVSTLHKRSPHVLRHTFATTMLNNGADINAIKNILGHESLRATEVYTHTTFDQLHDIYQQAHPRAEKKRRNHEH